MAWTLDEAVVDTVKPASESLLARAGATHIFCIELRAHGPAGTLSSSTPIYAVIGDPIFIEKTMFNDAGVVYGWNGSLEAPTITPDIVGSGRGGLCCRLEDGMLYPLPDNKEALLTEPVRVSRRNNRPPT